SSTTVAAAVPAVAARAGELRRRRRRRRRLRRPRHRGESFRAARRGDPQIALVRGGAHGVDHGAVPQAVPDRLRGGQPVAHARVVAVPRQPDAEGVLLPAGDVCREGQQQGGRGDVLAGHRRRRGVVLRRCRYPAQVERRLRHREVGVHVRRRLPQQHRSDGHRGEDRAVDRVHRPLTLRRRGRGRGRGRRLESTAAAADTRRRRRQRHRRLAPSALLRLHQRPAAVRRCSHELSRVHLAGHEVDKALPDGDLAENPEETGEVVHETGEVPVLNQPRQAGRRGRGKPRPLQRRRGGRRRRLRLRS
ncbi:unnamed protein product, partial [Ectocarpus sp. 8 AP-2014]